MFASPALSKQQKHSAFSLIKKEQKRISPCLPTAQQYTTLKLTPFLYQKIIWGEKKSIDRASLKRKKKTFYPTAHEETI